MRIYLSASLTNKKSGQNGGYAAYLVTIWGLSRVVLRIFCNLKMAVRHEVAHNEWPIGKDRLWQVSDASSHSQGRCW
jgi:hypothetical protein